MKQVACVLLVLFVLTLPSRVQAVAPGATVSAEAIPGTSQVNVHVTNRSTKPIEAWQVNLNYTDATGRSRNISFLTDACAERVFEKKPGIGSISPTEVRTRKIELGAIPVTLDATVTFVLYEDLASEGPDATKKEVFDLREKQAQTYLYWIDILTDLERRSSTNAIDKLRTTLDTEERRAALTPQDSYATQIRGSLRQLVGQGADNPAKFQSDVKAVRLRMQQRRTLSLRHQK